MKGDMMTYIIFSALLVIIVNTPTFAQQTYTYYAYPNLTVPSEGEPGIADTIVIPDRVTIEDINFYVGLNTYTLGGELIISVESPGATAVILDNHNHLREYLNCWFDTEEEEDGPGNLDDYVSINSSGPWIMNIVRYGGSFPFIWDSWAIEVIGEPMAGIDEVDLPLTTGLKKAYPNPFNSTTVLHYSLAEPAEVTFNIYDVTGRLVRQYNEGQQFAGRYQLKWDGRNGTGETVTSGIYFARMTALSGNESRLFTRRLTLLK
jgi:subtilisin-like proprotein convertase family protein